jgi:AcrR family transcriptional regulator
VSDAPTTGNRRGAATRRRILEAAERCFERDGLHLTLDQVAREADTTRMTVHRHTGGREALIRHVVLRTSKGVVDDIAAALEQDGPFAERLVPAMAVAVARLRSMPAMLALFAPGGERDGWWTVDPDDQVVDAVRAFLRPYFDAASEAGELVEAPEQSLEWALHQLLFYLAVPEAVDQDGVEDELRTFVVPALTRR